MNPIKNARRTLKQEASISDILFSTEEQRLFKRTIRFIVASVVFGYAVASWLFNWWIALIGLAGLTAVSIAPIIRWNRMRFVRAFFDLCRDSGSAEVLTGKVHYAVIFVRPNQRLENRVDHALAELGKAFEYLSAEAHRYGKKVVFDHTTKLMWQQSGSSGSTTIYENAKKYIDQLNRERFAGFNDWRLPTLEEAMSLMEPEKSSNGLYIEPVFDETQRFIWTSDQYSASRAWSVGFTYGGCGPNPLGIVISVRAVRSGH